MAEEICAGIGMCGVRDDGERMFLGVSGAFDLGGWENGDGGAP